MSYAIQFQMCKNPWSAGVIIFDDGQAKLNRHLISPDKPVLVQLEGEKPSVDQVQMCRYLWSRLHEAMDFRVASFCPALLPYSNVIMEPVAA